MLATPRTVFRIASDVPGSAEGVAAASLDYETEADALRAVLCYGLKNARVIPYDVYVLPLAAPSATVSFEPLGPGVWR
jgi:hypothetical protein